MDVMSGDLLTNFEFDCVEEFLSVRAYRALPPEQQLTLCYAYYHYFNGNPDTFSTLLCGGMLYKNGKASHQIAGIFPAADEDKVEEGTIDLLVPYHTTAKINATELGKRLGEIYDSCNDYLGNLRRQASSGFTRDDVEKRLRMLGFTGLGASDHPIRIRFILNQKVSKKEPQTLETNFDKTRKTKTLDYDFIYSDDIEYEVYNTASAFQSVAEGSLVIDDADHICEYKNSNIPVKAYVVNVRASSFKALYQKKRHRGLFAQNLRFYIKDKSGVDEKIQHSIATNPDYFWYLNNGITIACSSCTINGTLVTLKDFSIINGGQTTHNIGNAPDIPKDFFLCCKIICNPAGMNDEDDADLLTQVAISSNQQKPIRKQDLIANHKIQRDLKKRLANTPATPILYAIKRGEKNQPESLPETLASHQCHRSPPVAPHPQQATPWESPQPKKCKYRTLS